MFSWNICNAAMLHLSESVCKCIELSVVMPHYGKFTPHGGIRDLFNEIGYCEKMDEQCCMCVLFCRSNSFAYVTVPDSINRHSY